MGLSGAVRTHRVMYMSLLPHEFSGADGKLFPSLVDSTDIFCVENLDSWKVYLDTCSGHSGQCCSFIPLPDGMFEPWRCD